MMRLWTAVAVCALLAGFAVAAGEQADASSKYEDAAAVGDDWEVEEGDVLDDEAYGDEAGGIGQAPTEELAAAVDAIVASKADIKAAADAESAAALQQAAEGVALLRERAAEGSGYAQGMLALLLASGVGLQGEAARGLAWPAEEEALALLRQASKSGDSVYAEVALAFRLLTGVGGAKKNCMAALQLYAGLAHEAVTMAGGLGSSALWPAVRLSEYVQDVSLGQTAGQERSFEDYYANLADTGDAEAAHSLGEMYYYGDAGMDIPQDFDRARQYFEAGARGGVAASKTNLALMYSSGMGVEANESKAIEYFEEAAAEGESSAQLGLGLAYMSGAGVQKNYTRAKELFEAVVQDGLPEGSTNMGILHLNGWGVPRNVSAAVAAFKEAAASGQPTARYNLAILQWQGKNGKFNCSQVAHEMKAIVDSSASLLDQEFGLEFGYAAFSDGDYAAALRHYLLAAEMGLELAMANAVTLLRMPGSVTQAAPLPEHWQPRADCGGDGDDGSDGGSDACKLDMWRNARARLLLQRAELLDSAEGMRQLGHCMHTGWPGGCDVDEQQAAAAYRRAAEQGDAESMYELGNMLETGVGVPQDGPEAMRLYNNCAHSNSSSVSVYPCTLALYRAQLRGWWQWATDWSAWLPSDGNEL